MRGLYVVTDYKGNIVAHGYDYWDTNEEGRQYMKETCEALKKLFKDTLGEERYKKYFKE